MRQDEPSELTEKQSPTLEHLNAEKTPALLARQGGQSQSLWNCSIAPGWSKPEEDLFEKAVMKFGVGKWKRLVESGLFKSENIRRLQSKLCRLLGQQTLVGFIGLHIDIKAVKADNDKKTGKRKGGCLVSAVEKLTRA